MHYINKNTGEVGAYCEYASHGSWNIYPTSNNRYRILKREGIITALDLNIGGVFGMVEVGKEMPGYNRVVNEIVQTTTPGDDGVITYFEVYCDDEYTIG